MDLLETLELPEGKTLEFKRDLSSRAGILRTVIAFANTAGGTLVLGVEDGTRHVRGVPEPLMLEEQVANLLSDSSVAASCRTWKSRRGVASSPVRARRPSKEPGSH